MLSPLSLCQAEESTRIWRIPENESINAIYLLLRCNNLSCDYESLEAKLKPSSTTQNLSSLRDQAREYGLKLDVFQCSSPEPLNRIQIPFLIHSEEGNDVSDTEWKGNFLLVIGRGHGHYMILDCGTIDISEMSEETLHRYWSGYVLGKLPKTKPSFFQMPVFLSSMTGLGVLLLYWGIFTNKRFSSYPVVLFAGLVLYVVPISYAKESPLPTVFTSRQIKVGLLETANSLKSLKVYYRSEYYMTLKASPKSYLYRKILAKSPYYL